MELRQLQSFLTVAEKGSISRASQSLHLTQPAVTKQMRALEQEVGATLFNRTGRGIELTAAGVALRDYARRSGALLDEYRRVLADLEEGAVGQLVVGAGGTTSIFQLPGWLRALQQALPGVDVAVRTGDSREVIRMVLEREADVGLITTPVQHPDLRVVNLYEEEIVLVVPPDHPDARREVRAAEVSGYPLILFPPSSGFREYLDRELNRAGVAMHVKMESDSVEAVKSFVAVGLGASFLPSGAVAAEIEARVLSQVQMSELPALRRQTAVIHRTDRYLGAGARAFLKILSDCYSAQVLSP